MPLLAELFVSKRKDEDDFAKKWVKLCEGSISVDEWTVEVLGLENIDITTEQRGRYNDLLLISGYIICALAKRDIINQQADKKWKNESVDNISWPSHASLAHYLKKNI